LGVSIPVNAAPELDKVIAHLELMPLRMRGWNGRPTASGPAGELLKSGKRTGKRLKKCSQTSMDAVVFATVQRKGSPTSSAPELAQNAHIDDTPAM
jgi:hypothetical protein